MADEERLVTALRAAGLFYRANDAGCEVIDAPAEEILKATEGTLLRARVEAGLAWDDLWAEAVVVVRPIQIRFYEALIRVFEWLTRKGE